MRFCSILLAALTVALVPSADARACSCWLGPGLHAPVVHGEDAEVVGFHYATDLLPADGNLWFVSAWLESIGEEWRLISSDGEEVSGSWTKIKALRQEPTGIEVFHPAELLEEGSEVHIELRENDGSWSPYIRVPIGPPSAEGRPEVPAFDSVTWRELPLSEVGSCFSSNDAGGRGYALDAEFQLAGIDDQGLLVMDIAEPAGLDADQLEGHVAVAGRRAAGSSTTLCASSMWLYDLAEQPTEVRWGAFDLTGAFSGWSEWTVVPPRGAPPPAGDDPETSEDVPAGPGCQGGASMALLGLTGLVLGRRKAIRALPGGVADEQDR